MRDLAARLARPLAAGAVAIVVAASSSQAQQLRGAVRAGSPTGAPVGGATVFLVDSAGTRRAAALTDDAGRFALRAPTPGRYALRVRRLGFRPLDGALETLAAGQSVTRTLTLAAQAIALAGMRVTTAAGCPRDADADEAARYWSATRALLEGAAAAEETGLLRVHATVWERDVDADRVPLRAREAEQTAPAARPFAAADPARLAAYGFSETSGDSTTYYAPDAAVLVSEAFAAGHCVRLVRADSAHPGAVGLAFEPARERSVVDVRGVLWVDGATAAPRAFAFDYRWPRLLVPAAVAARYGGEIDFDTLHSGTVVVRQWALRLPLPVAERRGAPSRWGVRTVGAELRDVRAAGGALLGAWDAGGRLRPPLPGALVGVVYDSLHGAPVAGAQVLVSRRLGAPGDTVRPSPDAPADAAEGGLFVATTDDEGRWRLDTLPAGRYLVAVAAAQLDSAGVRVPDVPATLLGGDTARVELYVPGAVALLATLCPAPAGDDAGVLLGTVRGAAPASVVELSWGGARGARGVRGAVRAPLDSAGAYRACGVPRLLPVRLRLLADGGAHAVAEAAIAGQRAAVATGDFVVRDGTLVASGGSGATTLATVRVTERAAPPEPNARALTGGGGRAMVFDRATIARRNPSRPSDLLRGHASLVVSADGIVTTRDRVMNDTRAGTACTFQLYLNGRPYSGESIDEFTPAQIARLEVYTSGTSLPTAYTGLRSGCGVIVVWTEEPRPAHR